MRNIGTLVFLALLATSASRPAHAGDVPVAAKLSAALGGFQGDGMSDAGGAGHGRYDADVELRPGRNDAFRKQVLAENSTQRRVATR